MAEILVLTVSDFPFLRLKPQYMSNVIQGNIGKGWVDKPHLKEPGNWPTEMQEAWAGDQGAAAGKVVQDRQIEQFRRLRGALDDFRPDFMVFFFRELGETFGTYARPQYWVQAHEQVTTKLFHVFGNRENYFEEDPDREDVLRGHRQGAMHLVRGLQDEGRNPLYTLEPTLPSGLGHCALATTVHLDWDKREFLTPIVPVGVDPFGFMRVRNNEGMTEWDKSLPRPLTPKEAFELGQSIARIYKASPWKVALVAGVGWSHANDTGLEFERLHPDIDADAARFEQWRNNRFTEWGDNWSFEEMEEHAQWEMLITIILAGAMSQIGAKIAHTDFLPTWLFNSNFVNTIFEVK
ncbi:MAG: hypothetical protein V3S98_11150 [Dehalococcoidia bacterium]